MLSLFKRKRKVAVQDGAVEQVESDEPDEYLEAEPAEARRRMKQQNIKASEDCCAIFAALAEAEDMSKAQLFEDMVAERYETLRRRGIDVATLNH